MTSQTSEIDYISDAERKVGRNRLTLRRWWKKFKFPQPVLICNRLAWRADVINQWISDNTNTQEVTHNEETNP